MAKGGRSCEENLVECTTGEAKENFEAQLRPFCPQRGGGGGGTPYMGYIGMCGPKGYGFLAVLVRNRDFGQFGLK